ncbi:hypothetical protein [Pseudovibrio sp. Ad26]|uniref:hypothetical protein n=1 Tax=Pseudovibrio sp. Ad26 TaxID=989410 RepID=UPI0007B2651E|nr:hypothetical protein [Pseudovibrio sp. Ad26]KZL05894.1 hypothetical protein PsAD26_04035 [Pseudovibrio sp. Ad26]
MTFCRKAGAMVQECKIIIRNRSDQTCGFYLFQLQPSYVVLGGVPPVVQSCCVCSGNVAPYSASGPQLEFAFREHVLAGAVREKRSASSSGRYVSTTGQDETDALEFVSQRMLGTQSSADRVSLNCTRLNAKLLGLSPSANEAGVTLRSFRISILSDSDDDLLGVGCGNAIQHSDGRVVLSSFVRPVAGTQIDCAPLFAFWLSIGSYDEGEVVPYNLAGSAPVLIEFAIDGPQIVVVDYNTDGTFSPGE